MEDTSANYTSGIEYCRLRNLDNTNVINCSFCGADNIIELEYQGQIFCWQCGKEIQ